MASEDPKTSVLASTDNETEPATLTEADVSKPSFSVIAKAIMKASSQAGEWSFADLVVGLRYLKSHKQRYVDHEVFGDQSEGEELEHEAEEAAEAAAKGKKPKKARRHANPLLPITRDFPDTKDERLLGNLRSWFAIIDATYLGTDAKVRQRCNLSEEELIESSWKSTALKPAYFICLANDAVVLAIRGTDSTSDALTDLCAHASPFMDGFGHHGIVNSVEWFDKNITEKLKGLLEQHEGKKLVIVGHSLGAGTAAMYTMLLRRREEFAQYEPFCYAFAPPACVSEDLCEDKCVTTLVLNADMIPRSSITSVQHLRRDLDELNWRELASRDFHNMEATKKAKQVIDAVASSSFAASVSTGFGLFKKKVSETKQRAAETETGKKAAVHAATAKAKASEVGSRAAESVSAAAASAVAKMKTAAGLDTDSEDEVHEAVLYPPGRIHLMVALDPEIEEGEEEEEPEPTEEQRSEPAAPLYRLVDAKPHIFTDFVLTGRMVKDHLLSSYGAALDALAEATNSE